ncbi:endoglucanase B [Verticillium alfalfae VaMs.102]|uniref:Endoglucanase B n=1 Tax=Verticillium alfalfae (strain VaMs.102 / ATCC MYA-4576 / FGSC 10136) TaxID=526221 RepID=C9SGA5_VERA1|nr:endoglucanase B [Verticillium alfalfae VaMs.102]EEY17445.1 endoglucanase B [Verticillium alfalfae VaMs.102]
MKSQIGFAALLALSNQALAQQTAYGQCGGNGWTGLTTCVSGYFCNAYHELHSRPSPPGHNHHGPGSSWHDDQHQTCHHTEDSWEWADVRSGDLVVIQQRFRAIWVQIAKKLACKSSRVSFESINEPPADNAVDGANVNKFNELFVSAVNEAGGHNAKRVLQLAGGVSDPIKTTQWFKAPANIQNPWALQFHYYSPYDFIFGAWGKTIWGSAADRAALTADFQAVRGNFSNVPLVLGEFDASPLNTEPAARWKWTDHLARIATDLGVALVIWDNGLDHLDRNTGVWRDPVSIALIEAAVAGERSSLPDSTEDAGASTQSSSAYLWNKVGNAVADQVLPWLFNGNTLTGITTQTGDALSAGSDYTVSSNAITFKAGFLSDYLGPNVTPGSKANLTLTFSAGAHSNIEVVQWDTPVLVTEPDATPGQDLQIPINGRAYPCLPLCVLRLPTAPSCSMTGRSGSDLCNVDACHYFWEGSNVILRASAIAAVLELNKAVKFTFEFYPRVAGNSVTYTLDPTDEC